MSQIIEQLVRNKTIIAAIRVLTVSVVSIAIALLFPFPTASWAADLPSATIAALQSAPFEEQPATLISPREGAAIPLYIRPAPNQQPVGYGISGDPVTITDQFGDYLMEDDPGATWSHIRLNNAPYTEGWLRGRFLSMETPEQRMPEQEISGQEMSELGTPEQTTTD